jgi:hypothetical protein
MVSPELLSYIQRQLDHKTSPVHIRTTLLSKGWAAGDIDAVFLHIAHVPHGVVQKKRVQLPIVRTLAVGCLIIAFLILRVAL